jgi:NAD(P)-dependent dehydrogenase (short-subunit alcohol dehydrogenase family)
VNSFFDEKVALITGGTSGIGLAAAQKLTHRGARVAITGRDEQRGAAAVAQLGDGALYVQGDVKVAADVERAVEATVDAFGGLDILVNNAARSQSVLVVDESLEEWDDVVRSVLYSVFYATKYAVPHLEARGGGAIVNIGSSAALRPTPLLGAYAAAKAGVLNLTQLMAQELRDRRIRVNAINPGWILTPIIESVRHDFDDQLGMPLDDFVAKLQGRWGTPEEIADAIVHLCSDEAALVSGHIYNADNGFTARLW